MFKKIFKTRKQRKREAIIAKQKQLIKLAEENDIFIPPASDGGFRPYVGMPRGFHRSLGMRAEIAERELKKKGLI